MSSLINKDFIEMINYLASVWPQINNAMRVKRIYEAVKYLPKKAMDEIADTMIDNFKTMPTPEDFRQAAINWKKRQLRDPGNEVIEVTPIECIDCYETGYMFCKFNEKDPAVVVHCHCEIGSEKKERFDSCMPQWNNKFEPVYGFIKIKFPYQDFVPSGVKSYIELIQGDMVKSWKIKITESYLYWNSKNKEAKEEINESR